MKKLLTIGLLALTCLTSQAQTDVTPFVPGSTLEGVNYYLPRTALRIVVEAEKTVTTPGELAKYAFKYMRMNDVPTETSTDWKITKISMEPYGVPDKQKAYNVKVKSKTLAPLVSLTRDGILMAINKEVEEDVLPSIPEGEEAPALPDPKKFMSQDMLAASSTAKLADLCAQEIYDIRDSRNALVRGEAENTPKDGAQLKLMLEQLDEQANVLESLFSGSVQTSTEVFSFNYIPEQETEKELLFRFSKKLGRVDNDDLAGEPIYVKVKNMETVPPVQEDIQTSKKKEKIEKGVYYNVPSKAQITVFTPQTQYATIETPMGQFGTVEILSSLLFDKKTTTQVTFFQSTGGTKDVME